MHSNESPTIGHPELVPLCAGFRPRSNPELWHAFDALHETFADRAVPEQLAIDRRLGSLLADAGERMGGER